MNSRWMRWLVVSAAVVTVAAAGLPGPARAAAAPLSAPTGTGRAVGTVGAIRADGLGPTLGPSVPGRLTAVAATSADDVWAVGLTSGPPLILHWNGGAWSQYLISPDLYFLGVAAVSRSNAWAVGGTNWSAPSLTDAYHWNGKTWTQVPTPTPDGSAFFSAVAATSATNAWAVGDTGPGPGGPDSANAAMLEHWNGKTWKRQSVPVPDKPSGFAGVAATSARNAWAVGWTGAPGRVQAALIEHWDGRKWQRMPAPAGTPGDSFLTAVAATGSCNVWAVGTTLASDGLGKTLILHWNGTQWSVVPSPTPAGNSDLLSVAASSQRNAWAVGYDRGYGPSSCSPRCQTIALHWNGTHWSRVPSPNPPAEYLDGFLGVVAIHACDAWAVGTTDYASTLIAHWNGHTWS
jgi:hypothetical protein